MERNPYQAPAATAGQHSSHTPSYSVEGAGVGPSTVSLLLRIRPWWRFFSVLMFIGVALGGIGLLVALGTAAQTGGAGILPAVLVGAASLAIYFFMAIKLWSSANGTNRLAQSNSVADLDFVLEQQRSLWNVVGILTVAILVLYIFIIAVAGTAVFNGRGLLP
jgi:hypothetical protein